MTTASPRSSRRFPSTHWSAIFLASRLDAEKGRRALDDLLRRYLSPLTAHVKARFRVDQPQAEDWLQEFVLNRILEKEFLNQAQPGRGRFRTFLLTSLDNFICSQLRHRNRQKRGPAGGHVNWDDLAAQDWGGTPDKVQSEFDRQWALTVVQEALGRMEQHCRQSGRTDIWEVFKGRYVGPILHDCPAIPYETMAVRFGLKTAVQAANLLTTAKRQFQRTLRTVVAEYVSSEAEVDNEIQELLTILAR